MADQISQGAVHDLYYSDPAPECGAFQPTLQALSVKRIQTPAGNTTERYRVILSDGQHYLQSMLATQLNPLVEAKQIDKNSLLKLTGYSMNYVQGRRLLILLAAEVVQAQVEQKIGNPSAIDNLGAPNAGGGANPGSNPSAGATAPKAESGSNSNSNSNSNIKPSVPDSKPAQSGSARGGAAGARGGRGGAAARGGAAGGAGGRGGAPMGPLYPIEGLSPYQNKWTIKARVTQKSDIKHWSNQRGEGKLFSVTLMDETAEIKATGFNEAVDNFYEKLQEGKVYYVSRARVNIAKKQFSNINNEYEIMFENNTEIEPCDDDNVPQVQYKFVPISEIANVEKDQTVDLLAVVKEVGELGSITSKATQKPFAKRDLTLVDQSQHSIRLTLWGKQAENFKGDDQPVIAAKGVKVGDFGGRSLSMFSSSSMSIHPDIDQAHALKGWFEAEGNSVQYQTYSNSGMGGAGGGQAIRPDEIKTIGQVKDENIGTSDKTEYFSTRATINFVKHETFSYPACPADGCNKKVLEESDGWRCEKCDRSYQAPLHRYILSLSIMDHSGHIWVTAFNEVGEQLLGKTANELIDLKDQDEAAFSAAFTKAQASSLTFSCSARQDTFNDQTRIRYSIRRAIPIDYKTEALALAKLIEAM